MFNVNNKNELSAYFHDRKNYQRIKLQYLENLKNISSSDILKDVIKLVLDSDMKDSHYISDYVHDNVADKVCKIIIGYTDIINKFIWMK